MFKNRTIKILLIEDEEYDVRRIRNTIKLFEEQLRIVDVFSNGKTAVKVLQENENKYDVIIMDFQISGGLLGENLIKKIKEIDPTLQIIVLTKMTIKITDFEFASQLIEAGAMWYCTKYPGDIVDYIYQPTDFILSIFNAYEKRRLEKERLKSASKLNLNIETTLSQHPLIGESDYMKELHQQIDYLAKIDSTVIIEGDSGTGKELVATHIHYKSSRRYEKLMTINCGALPAELIESELFGYEKGAFTGADSAKPGLFEIANKGTVFLDEIGELPLSAQVKLLRVLQEGEVDKIGRTETINVNVRIIAATNKNLEQEIRAKRFREDLYYRLNVATVQIQPLRYRNKDILPLVDHFMKIYSANIGVDVPVIDAKAMELLICHHWPGNVRELQNIVQKLLFLNKAYLGPSHVSSVLGQKLPAVTDKNQPVLFDVDHILPWRDMEEILCREYFRFVRNNTTSDADAARTLGLAPSNYHRICKNLGLK
jgi:two-component system, NtrC family, response regulator AtoC